MKNLIYISIIGLLLMSSCASNKVTKVKEDKTVYEIVDEIPELPGGLNNYIRKTLRYPVIAQEHKITGMVLVRFIVEKDGAVTNVKITKPVDPSLDKESIRVIKAMPKWIPGKKNGKIVRTSITIPLNYRLN